MHTNRSPHRKWLIASAAMSILAVIQRGAGLILMIFLARILDARGVGVYAFTQSTSQTFYGFGRLGVDLGMQVSLASLDLKRDREKMEQLLGQSLTIFLAIAVAVGLVMALFAGFIASQIFDATELAPFVLAAAVLFAGQVFSQYAYSVFSGLNSFPIYSRLALVASLMTMVIVIGGAFWGGPVGASWGLAVAQVLTAIYFLIRLARLFKALGIQIQLRLPSGAVAGIFKIGFPFYAGGLFLIPVEFMNMALLSRSLGVAALSDLRITQALMSIASFLPTAIAGPALTFLTERHSVGEGRASFLVQLKVVWLLIIVVAIGLVAVWPFAVRAVFGAGFDVAQAVGVLSVVGLIPTMLLSVMHGSLMARRRSNALFGIGVVHAVVLAFFGWSLIHRYGLAGFLMSQAASALVGVGLTYYTLCAEDASLKPTRWMGWLCAVTVFIVGAISLDIAIDSNQIYRLVAALFILSIFTVIASKCVITDDERRAIFESSFGVLERLRSKFMPSER